MLLSTIAALRELLREVLPPALQDAIHAEQTVHDEEEARWEPVNY